jgi:hypothetical protein
MRLAEVREPRMVMWAAPAPLTGSSRGVQMPSRADSRRLFAAGISALGLSSRSSRVDPGDLLHLPSSAIPSLDPATCGRRRTSAAATLAWVHAGRLLELAPVTGGCGIAGVVGGVVAVELAFSPPGNHPKDAQVQAGHDRSPPGSRIGIETATASGSSCGTSSRTNSLNPTTAAASPIDCSGRSHSGQLTRYAAAAEVNRSLQLGQPVWVITDPFR